jgi:hypothetical protein
MLRNFVTLVLCLAFATGALAQSGDNTGLSGVVLDPAWAAIQGSVEIRHADVGEARSAPTNGEGYWEARFLSPGLYVVTFQSPRFKKMTREGVNVTSGMSRGLDVTLPVGEVVENVTVLADAELVSVESAAIGRNVSQVELDSLPIYSRNFTQLLVIEPGVSADLSELLSNNNASISPSVNGARTTNNSLVFNLEFRSEFYNLTNTPIFRNPERDLTSGDYGEITKSRGGPRVIQFALRLRF